MLRNLRSPEHQTFPDLPLVLTHRARDAENGDLHNVQVTENVETILV